MKKIAPIPEIPDITEEHLKALEVLYDLASSKNPALNRLKRCPATGTFHFAEHGGTHFLSEKHAEEFYNRNRSNFKQAQGTLQRHIPNNFVEEKKSEIIADPVVPLTLATPLNPYEGFQITDEVERKKTQKFLENLLGNKSSIKLKFSYLNSPDFNLKAFDQICSIPNSDLTFSIYGKFVTCWWEEETILITTLKQMLWTF